MLDSEANFPASIFVSCFLSSAACLARHNFNFWLLIFASKCVIARMHSLQRKILLPLTAYPRYHPAEHDNRPNWLSYLWIDVRWKRPIKRIEGILRSCASSTKCNGRVQEHDWSSEGRELIREFVIILDAQRVKNFGCRVSMNVDIAWLQTEQLKFGGIYRRTLYRHLFRQIHKSSKACRGPFTYVRTQVLEPVLL